MEDFISFILGIASEDVVRPVYSIVATDRMDEKVATHLGGYRGDGPVRIGNAAVEQLQHDSHGSIILAAVPMFFDRRLPQPGDTGLFRLLERLGHTAARSAFEPDAGIWEYRGRMRVHTHSTAMCWAGCNRLAAIAAHLGDGGSCRSLVCRSTEYSITIANVGMERKAWLVHRCNRARANSTPAFFCFRKSV